MTSVESMSELLDPPSDSKVESHGEPKANPRASVDPSIGDDQSREAVVSVGKDGRIEFFNAREPQYELKSERQLHRQIVIRAMESAKTNVELAEEFGVSNSMINYVLLQPWAKQYMSEHMHKHGMERVELLLKGAVADAVQVWIDEMKNPKARSAERTTAAEKIFDRVYGRAVQPMVHIQTQPAKEMSDAELDAEIERLQGQRNGRS